MGWLWVLLAGALEVCWAIGLKQSARGFDPLVWGVTGVSMGLSLGLLTLALRSLPLGTAYAAWTGIGMIGTVIAGMVFFAEPPTVLRLGFVLLILAGVVGLKAT